MNHFRSASFAEGKTYNECTDKFIGVDLTNPQMSVELKRGVSSNNYMLMPSGKVEKRYGYENIGTGYTILGCWDFVDHNNATHRVALMHYEGKNIFVAPEIGDDGNYLIFDPVNAKVSSYEATSDIVSQAYATASAGKLWVLTGTDYAVVYYDDTATALKAKKVTDSDFVHAPVVTYMGIATNATTIPDNTFITLEYPNLLSQYRKDMYLGGVGDTLPIYKFDKSSVYDIEDMEISIKENYNNGLGVYNEETLAFKAYEIKCSTAYLAADGGLSADDIVFANKCIGYISKAKYILTKDNYNPTLFISSTASANAVTEVKQQRENIPGSLGYTYYEGCLKVSFTIGGGGTGNNTDIVGCIIETTDSYEIVFFHDYPPFVSGQPNITFKYKWCDNTKFAGNLSFINKCTFGTRFGADNRINMLWLSGNSDKPNYAIHSSQPYLNLSDNSKLSQEDFGYFVDESYIKFGEDGNAVIAMDVVSVDKMAVIKGRYGNDRTMYFVTPTDMSREVADNISILDIEFSTAISNTATAGYSKHACLNFNGDLLFLSSEKQLVGLDIEGITGDSQRVANTRSFYIDGALADLDLSNARLFAYKNHLFLSCDSKLFVTSFLSFDSETRQYQWWPLDPIPEPIRTISVLSDGTLWINTEQNNIYVFTDRADCDGKAIDIARNIMVDRSNYFSYGTLSNGGINPAIDINEFPSVKDTIPNNGLAPIPSGYVTQSNGFMYTAKDIDTFKKLSNMEILYKYTQMGSEVVGRLYMRFYDGMTFMLIDANNGSTYTGSVDYLYYVKPDYKLDRLKFVVKHDLSDIVEGCIYFDYNTQPKVYRYEATKGLCAITDKLLKTVIHDGSKLLFEDYNGNYHFCEVFDCAIEPSDEVLEAEGYKGSLFFKLKDLSATPSAEVTFSSGDVGSEVQYAFHYICYLLPTENVYAFKDNNKIYLYLEEDKNIFRRLNLVPYPDESPYVYGYFEREKPIKSEFVTLRLTKGKIGYDKIINNVTVWNDSKSPSELYVGVLTNKQKHTYKENRVMDQGMSFDFDQTDFEHTTFSKNNVPTFYNLKRFPKNQQSLSIVFMSDSDSNSVLGGLDILYRVRKAHNKC